ncbi:MAG: FecR domain-containing protein [Bryobacteraceae bacterium]
MSNQDFERVLDSIREEDPGMDVIRAASERVRAKLEMRAVDMGGRLNSCEDFRALADAYREGSLSEARHMLVEDHLHSCVACRRFFRGDQKSTVVMMPVRRSRVGVVLPWAIAAAVLLVAGFTLPEYFNVLFAPSGARASVASIDGELYQVAPNGLTLLTVGSPIAENEQVRTAKDSRAVLKLRDGSLVEIAERSDLRLNERWSGKTVALERGSVMVEAAKQRRGRLEIMTPDCMVSVKGTIFSVSRGLKGSRVSVVEGEVKVEKSTGIEWLHHGDQTATSPTMARTTVAADISWSENSAKYVALLSELSTVQKRLDAMPGPEMRYSSKLTGVLPVNTAVFVSMPNLSSTLAEANAIFEERAKESPALNEWWNAEGAQKVRKIVDQVRTISDYLGDEIVLAVPAVGGVLGQPVMVAEERKKGLKEYLTSLPGNPRPDDRGYEVTEQGNLVVMGQTGTGFESTEFGKRIAQSYASGAGWLFAADMEQILAGRVEDSKTMNVGYLILERKQNLGRTENSATVSFRGERTGIASWIAAPAPMGTLDFISPDATFAASFVVNNPAVLLSQFPDIQKMTGFELAQDIAGTLGGEMTIAVDGPLLPTPGWKVAIEVNNPARLEWSIEQMVKAAQQAQPELNVQLTDELTGGLTYYTLSSAKSPVSVNYVFTDGYLLMAPNHSLLSTSIQNRTLGMTLTSSPTFKALLPQNGQMNFSALAYYNASAAIAPMADQLTNTKFLTAEQKKALAALTADRAPTLIYAYAKADRIVAATRGSFFGLGLDTLVGLNGVKGLMGPVLGKL